MLYKHEALLQDDSNYCHKGKGQELVLRQSGVHCQSPHDATAGRPNTPDQSTEGLGTAVDLSQCLRRSIIDLQATIKFC